jgi:hypothetical protein
MAKQALTDKTIEQAVMATGQRQTQQTQRVERVAGRHLQWHAVLPGQPQHLTVSPLALARNFSRTQLAVVLEHRGKQDGFVVHLVTQALQGVGQFFKCQPGKRRDEIQITGDVFHTE